MSRTRYVGLSMVLLVSALLVGVSIYGWMSWGQAGNGAGGVAIVDVDAVAKQLGADVAIQKQIKDTQTSLDEQLRSLQASLRKQYDEKSKESQVQKGGNAPSPNSPTAGRQELAELERKMNLQLAQAQQTARNKFNTYRVSLVQSFRAEVVPVAQKVARQHGLGVVLTKNDSVLLAFDRSHDITDAVAAELRKDRPTAIDQQAPALARSEPSSASAR